MRKSKGPSTLPCGTPLKVFCFSDTCEPISLYEGLVYAGLTFQDSHLKQLDRAKS